MSFVTSIKDFISATPDGIKQIAFATGMAVASVVLVGILANSIYAFSFVVQAAIILVSVAYCATVIKENIPNIKDAASGFFERRRAGASSFFKIFTFREKRATGAPSVAGEPAPKEYHYFPYMPSRTDIYNNLPANPFTWLYSTIVTGRQATGMEPEVPVTVKNNTNPTNPTNPNASPC